MVKEIKNKAVSTYKTAKNMEKHLEEILDAVSLTTLVAFGGYASYVNRDKFGYLLLGLAAGYAVFQAFRAWYRALNK